MEILKKGVPPVKSKDIICKNCRSELRYVKEDVHADNDPRDNNTDYWIDCPVCANQIIVERF